MLSRNLTAILEKSPARYEIYQFPHRQRGINFSQCWMRKNWNWHFKHRGGGGYSYNDQVGMLVVTFFGVDRWKDFCRWGIFDGVHFLPEVCFIILCFAYLRLLAHWFHGVFSGLKHWSATPNLVSVRSVRKFIW